MVFKEQNARAIRDRTQIRWRIRLFIKTRTKKTIAVYLIFKHYSIRNAIYFSPV